MEKKQYLPDPELPIWRYMEFHKFISLLHFQTLHFTRADRFEDAFEKKNVMDAFLQGPGAKTLQKAGKTGSPGIYISCWTHQEKESYAMWQIYARDHGVAVQTRVAKLQNALADPRVKVFKVRYLDLDGARAGRQGKEKLLAYTCKPKAYEYEQEVRALVADPGEDSSINIKVQVAELIESIYISPFSGPWFVDLVEDLVSNRYGLSHKNIFMSDIKINKMRP